MRRRHDRGVGIQQAFLVWTQTQLDQRARIGQGLRLPAIGFLVLRQRVFGRLVPLAGWLTRKVVLVDQRLLNLAGAPGIDTVLPVGYCRS